MKIILFVSVCLVSCAVLTRAEMEKQLPQPPPVPYDKKRPEFYPEGSPERAEAEKFWAEYRGKKRAWVEAWHQSLDAQTQHETLAHPVRGKLARDVAKATDKTGVVWVDKMPEDSRLAYDKAALRSFAGKPAEPTALFKTIVGGTTGHDKDVFNAVQQVRSVSHGRNYKIENMVKAVRGQIPTEAKITDEQISKLLSVPDVESLFEKWSSLPIK